MDDKPLLDYTLRQVLGKFGKGSHTPGSGSAAALQGMVAAQLIHTVIEITSDEAHRERYLDVLPELSQIKERIAGEILPSLEGLFQRDAMLFDKVIQLRRDRDHEIDPVKVQRLKEKASEALKPATEILLDIGDKCADLAYAGIIAFDKGYRAAKGDSGVALNAAVAGLAGCLSIIDLNLSLFGSNAWTIGVRDKVEALRTELKNFAAEAASRMEGFTSESWKKSFKLAKDDLNSGRWEGVQLSNRGIESVAEQVVNMIWDFRQILLPANATKKIYEMLMPQVVFEKVLDYKFVFDSLGFYGEGGSAFEVAGIINKKDKLVIISKDVPIEERNFTAAHELGHALLHEQMGELHRDRPLNGGDSTDRNIKEVQANKFATYFLMPAAVVRDVFRELFSIEQFVVNDATVFKVSNLGVGEFKRRYGRRRHVSRFIAQFKGSTFQPIHRIFGVSVEAMAIRLEELDLVPQLEYEQRGR